MIRSAIVLALCLSALPALADVGPPQPPPPPPPGAEKARVAGLDLERQWLYWRGRRWAVVVTGCGDPAAPACQSGQPDLGNCHIVGLDGVRIEDGDVQAVVDFAAAHPGPLTLMLEACAIESAAVPR